MQENQAWYPTTSALQNQQTDNSNYFYGYGQPWERPVNSYNQQEYYNRPGQYSMNGNMRTCNENQGFGSDSSTYQCPPMYFRQDVAHSEALSNGVRPRPARNSTGIQNGISPHGGQPSSINSRLKSPRCVTRPNDSEIENFSSVFTQSLTSLYSQDTEGNFEEKTTFKCDSDAPPNDTELTTCLRQKNEDVPANCNNEYSFNAFNPGMEDHHHQGMGTFEPLKIKQEIPDMDMETQMPYGSYSMDDSYVKRRRSLADAYSRKRKRASVSSMSYRTQNGVDSVDTKAADVYHSQSQWIPNAVQACSTNGSSSTDTYQTEFSSTSPSTNYDAFENIRGIKRQPGKPRGSRGRAANKETRVQNAIKRIPKKVSPITVYAKVHDDRVLEVTCRRYKKRTKPATSEDGPGSHNDNGFQRMNETWENTYNSVGKVVQNLVDKVVASSMPKRTIDLTRISPIKAKELLFRFCSDYSLDYRDFQDFNEILNTNMTNEDEENVPRNRKKRTATIEREEINTRKNEKTIEKEEEIHQSEQKCETNPKKELGDKDMEKSTEKNAESKQPQKQERKVGRPKKQPVVQEDQQRVLRNLPSRQPVKQAKKAKKTERRVKNRYPKRKAARGGRGGRGKKLKILIDISKEDSCPPEILELESDSSRQTLLSKTDKDDIVEDVDDDDEEDEEIKKIDKYEEEEIKNINKYEEEEIKNINKYEEEEIKNTSKYEVEEIKNINKYEEEEIKKIFKYEEEKVKKLGKYEKKEIKKVDKHEEDVIKKKDKCEKEEIKEIDKHEEEIKIDKCAKEEVKKIHKYEEEAEIKKIHKYEEETEEQADRAQESSQPKCPSEDEDEKEQPETDDVSTIVEENVVLEPDCAPSETERHNITESSCPTAGIEDVTDMVKKIKKEVDDEDTRLRQPPQLVCMAPEDRKIEKLLLDPNQEKSITNFANVSEDGHESPAYPVTNGVTDVEEADTPSPPKLRKTCVTSYHLNMSSESNSCDDETAVDSDDPDDKLVIDMDPPEPEQETSDNENEEEINITAVDLQISKPNVAVEQDETIQARESSEDDDDDCVELNPQPDDDTAVEIVDLIIKQKPTPQADKYSLLKEKLLEKPIFKKVEDELLEMQKAAAMSTSNERGPSRAEQEESILRTLLLETEGIASTSSGDGSGPSTSGIISLPGRSSTPNFDFLQHVESEISQMPDFPTDPPIDLSEAMTLLNQSNPYINTSSSETTDDSQTLNFDGAMLPGPSHEGSREDIPKDSAELQERVKKLKNEVQYLQMMSEQKEREKVAIICFKRYKEEILKRIYRTYQFTVQDHVRDWISARRENLRESRLASASRSNTHKAHRNQNSRISEAARLAVESFKDLNIYPTPAPAHSSTNHRPQSIHSPQSLPKTQRNPQQAGEKVSAVETMVAKATENYGLDMRNLRDGLRTSPDAPAISGTILQQVLSSNPSQNSSSDQHRPWAPDKNPKKKGKSSSKKPLQPLASKPYTDSYAPLDMMMHRKEPPRKAPESYRNSPDSFRSAKSFQESERSRIESLFSEPVQPKATLSPYGTWSIQAGGRINQDRTKHSKPVSTVVRPSINISGQSSTTNMESPLQRQLNSHKTVPRPNFSIPSSLDALNYSQQSLIGERPSGSGERPSVSGERPSVSGERPSVSGERPSSRIFDRPSSRISDRPSSRISDRPSSRISDRPSSVSNERSLCMSNERPVSMNGERPLSINGERPLSVNGERSLAINGERPLAINGERPLAMNGERPLSMNGERPLSMNGERALAINGERALAINGERALAINGERPLAINGERPLAINGERSLAINGERSLAINGERSFSINGERPPSISVERPPSKSGEQLHNKTNVDHRQHAFGSSPLSSNSTMPYGGHIIRNNSSPLRTTVSTIKTVSAAQGSNTSSPNPNSSTPVLCMGCGVADAKYLCSGCRKHWYCSSHCQTLRWPEHSKMCTGRMFLPPDSSYS